MILFSRTWMLQPWIKACTLLILADQRTNLFLHQSPEVPLYLVHPTVPWTIQNLSTLLFCDLRLQSNVGTNSLNIKYLPWRNICICWKIIMCKLIRLYFPLIGEKRMLTGVYVMTTYRYHSPDVTNFLVHCSRLHLIGYNLPWRELLESYIALHTNSPISLP